MKWERLNVSQYRGKQTIFRLTLHFLRYAAQMKIIYSLSTLLLTLPSRYSINYSLPINYQSTVFDSGIKYTRLCMCDSIGDVFYEFTDIHTCSCHGCPGLQRRMRRRWNENQLKWRDPEAFHWQGLQFLNEIFKTCQLQRQKANTNYYVIPTTSLLFLFFFLFFIMKIIN